MKFFSNITITLEGPNKTPTCYKPDVGKYSASQMSDGERQIFGLIADLVEPDENLEVVFVDEPELNLNPQLAIRFWQMLETTLADVTFIYATHNLSFALRENVEKLFILTGDYKKIEVSHSFAELDEADARQFLGAVPSIVISNNAILVEGKDTSFDKDFYTWILGVDRTFKIFPEGSCTNVISTMTKKDFWNKLAPHAKLTGIIDRDFLKIEAISEHQRNDGVIVLGLHEAESYLCLPDLLLEVDNKVRLLDKRVTKVEIEKEIVAYAKECVVRTALTRTLNSQKKVAIERHYISGFDSIEQVKEHIEMSYEIEVADLFNMDLDEEYSELSAVILEANIYKILSYFPGKQLLTRLSDMIALTPSKILSAVKNHGICPRSFEKASSLRNKISAELSV